MSSDGSVSVRRRRKKGTNAPISMTLKSQRLLLLYLFLHYLVVVSCIESKDENKTEEAAFVPTHEWQDVKKGTPLPAGLHIRHNLQTGKTEAKLISEDENKDRKPDLAKSLMLHPEEVLKDDGTSNPGEKKQESPDIPPLEELKARLKKLKLSRESEKKAETQPKGEPAKEKYRSYEELKKEMESLRLNVSTEAEILSELFEDFERHRKSIIYAERSSDAEIQRVLTYLNDLEYLIHQVDNAQLFATMDGMKKIVSPCLNSTNDSIKAEALKLLGAAVQSNPKVQLEAMGSDMIQKTLQLLTTSQDPQVLSRCLFALGAMVRNFPLAQKMLLDHGAFAIFTKVLAEPQTPRKIQIRVLRLVNDLTLERLNLNKIEDEATRLQRVRDYSMTVFREKLASYNYCQNLNALLDESFHRAAKFHLTLDDFEFFDIVCQSMITLGPFCRQDFEKNANLSHLLRDILGKATNFDFQNDETRDNLISHLGELEKIVGNSNFRDEL